jgi:hypothetical protein
VAVRFSASGQTYSATTGLPSSAFTFTGWAYLTTDRNAASGIFSLASTWNSNLVTDSDGTTLRLTDTFSGSVGSFALSTGTWYKLAITQSSTTGVFYHASAANALTSDSGSLQSISSPSTWRIGCSNSTSNWWNGRLAAVKVWTVALTASEIAQELNCYIPLRTTNLARWHPFLSAETTDYSGQGRTLSGGSGTATEDGPPIQWSPFPHQLLIPWDPTSTVWYAVYDTTTGELLSTGSVDPTPLAAGQALKEYINGQPDLSRYVWDTTARDFVLKPDLGLIDRVADLLADGTLTSAWAALSGTQSQAMQDRVGQMLGSRRYRLPTEPIDLD